MIEKVNQDTDRITSLFRNRGVKLAATGLAYAVLSFSSIWLAYQLRFDFFVSASIAENEYRSAIIGVALWVIPVKLFTLAFFRQFSGLLSYFGTPDLYRLFRAVCVGSAVLGLIRLQYASIAILPRGVILIDFIVSFGLLAGFRVACRVVREIIVAKHDLILGSKGARIVVIGAGDVGANLAKELLIRRGLGRMPVVFLDDDVNKLNTSIHNIKVVGTPSELARIRAEYSIDEAVIAMPSALPKRIAEIVKELQRLHIHFVTVPSLAQMTAGKVRLTQLRPIEIQDLLGRDPVSIERCEIGKLILGNIVLITGAGGSIGSELCRQIAGFNPERLLMLDHSEYHLFKIEQELIEMGYGGIELALVGNILDDGRMDGIFQRYRPSIVFHAAALKHVPMVEAQPLEAVKVNALGTARLAKMADRYDVSQFVMISTDKAINPTSVMGATKRLAEMYIQSLFAIRKNDGPSFMAVRFGNVLGSSGSVVPIFKHQIESGGPVKVTHKDVTRYFMTIPESVGLVLQCCTQGKGGDIFVLDMGESVRIVDLARQMIELSGFKPDEDIEIEYTGLRPGEKLFEELQHEAENMEETEHPSIRRFVCEAEAMDATDSVFKQLESLVALREDSNVKAILKQAVPEYRPYLD